MPHFDVIETLSRHSLDVNWRPGADQLHLSSLFPVHYLNGPSIRSYSVASARERSPLTSNSRWSSEDIRRPCLARGVVHKAVPLTLRCTIWSWPVDPHVLSEWHCDAAQELGNLIGLGFLGFRIRTYLKGCQNANKMEPFTQREDISLFLLNLNITVSISIYLSSLFVKSTVAIILIDIMKIIALAWSFIKKLS